MTSKKSQVKKRNMPYIYKDTTKPMKLENLSIRQLCIMELLSEESGRADLEGHGGCLDSHTRPYRSQSCRKDAREKRNR